MKVLLDTNVILDVWLAREPFWRDSAHLLARVEKKEVEGWVSPTTITTLHYLGRRVLGEKKARLLLESLLEITSLGKLSVRVFRSALTSKVTDFEDAVIEAVARHNSIDLIATRNLKDFKKSIVPAKDPSKI